MASLKCTVVCKNCHSDKIFHVSTKLLNDEGVFVETIENQWKYMYWCRVCSGFLYPNLKLFINKHIKKIIIKSKKSSI